MSGHTAPTNHMDSSTRIGRQFGLVYLVQVLIALPIYSAAGLMAPVMQTGFLQHAGDAAMRIRVGGLLTLLLSALTLAMALIALPLFRRYSERLAFLFLILSGIGLATQAIELVTLRTMVSMSVMYATPDAPREMLETLGSIWRSSWSSAHFTNLVFGHVKAFLLYFILFRFALVPRPLAAIGLGATVVSITAAMLPLLGQQFFYYLIAPTALVTLVLTIWLIVKGFADYRFDAALDERLPV